MIRVFTVYAMEDEDHPDLQAADMVAALEKAGFASILQVKVEV
jgi:hypothetical protein